MKKMLKVGNGLARIEKAILDCRQNRVECPECHHAFFRDESCVATKLAVGLQFNLDAIADGLKAARVNLNATSAMEKFENERVELMRRMATKSEAERIEALASLRDQHPLAMKDAEEFQKKNLEFGDIEKEVDLYRIPLTWVPGWFPDDLTDQDEIDKKNAMPTIPFSSLGVLMGFGILYDPAVEDRDGNPVKAASPDEAK